MFAKLLALFICVPLIELILLIQLGKLIGLGATIALVIITGFVGASLARQQGFKVWAGIQRELQAGHVPASGLIDGFLILIGGVVLLTPGLLTDLCGFALMIPQVRAWLRVLLEKRFKRVAARHQPGSRPDDDVIDI